MKSKFPYPIAFLLPTLDVGGAERVVLRTAAHIDRSRFTPTVVSFVRGGGKLAKELAEAKVPTVALYSGSTPSFTHCIRLLGWLRRHRPYVLLTYMSRANVAGCIVRKLRVVPNLICSERSALCESQLRLWLYKLTASWMDGFTVNSEASRDFWIEQLGISVEDVNVICNGVDTSVFTPGKIGGELVIGVLARLHHHNGIDWLLDALKEVETSIDKPWACRIAGEGPEAAALKEKVRRLGLEHRVQFLGHVDEPNRFLSSVTIAVHPARYSGMPNAVLEAMSCGCPVVATAVGGTPELIDHGTTGWLVRPDDPSGTAERLVDLLLHPVTCQKVGVAARKKVENKFSLEAMVSRTETVLTDTIHRVKDRL